MPLIIPRTPLLPRMAQCNVTHQVRIVPIAGVPCQTTRDLWYFWQDRAGWLPTRSDAKSINRGENIGHAHLIDTPFVVAHYLGIPA